MLIKYESVFFYVTYSINSIYLLQRIISSIISYIPIGDFTSN
nr:MAG TPA: hypothetical protein [Bacteriophage sp.]